MAWSRTGRGITRQTTTARASSRFAADFGCEGHEFDACYRSRHPPWQSTRRASSIVVSRSLSPPEQFEGRPAAATMDVFAATVPFALTALAPNDERLDPVCPRPTAVPPSQVETETPEQVLDRWDRSVRSPTATAFADTYPEKAYVHGFYSVRDTEARARGAWAERVRRRGWFRRGPRTRTEEIASQLSGSARLGCFDSSAPNATVLRFAAPAEWLNPLTHPAVPCPRIRGPYFWRMKRTPMGWRICHESWEQQDAICASCPQASPCRR